MARLKAVQNILVNFLYEGMKILDVGCGDGFVSMGLFANLRKKQVAAVDLHLSDELISTLNSENTGITFQREMPAKREFDLILLLDVIEHVQDDTLFLGNLVNHYLRKKGCVMITVPAFQFIYSGHDAFLGHYRRYSLKDLTQLTTACGLEVRWSGYLFSSLLLPKLIFFKFFNVAQCNEGVGHWRRGNSVTSFVTGFLMLDNIILSIVNRLGIKIPGLTGWVLCEKR